MLLSISCVLALLPAAHAFTTPLPHVRSTALSATADVVLFGVGDLRVDDHEGLRRASQNANVLPLVVLDDRTLRNIPGMRAHPIETTRMLYHAVESLRDALKQQHDLELQVITQAEALADIEGSLHVCDLGPADNAMGYGAYSDLVSSRLDVVPWSCRLRDAPWNAVGALPAMYPEYAKTFAQELNAPVEVSSVTSNLELEAGAPLDLEQFTKRVQSLLQLDDEQCEAQTNTGLYGTHWGGMDASSIRESTVHRFLETYVDVCDQQDAAFAKYLPTIQTNPNSLEHATMKWNMDFQPDNVNNLLEGELLIRYLAAPLLFGTISPRRIAKSIEANKDRFFTNPIHTFLEGQEWHRLFAAQCMKETAESTASQDLQYKYTRWHGFLCRYAMTTPTEDDDDAILFVHGFGASGTQWAKTIEELRSDNDDITCYAPDLLGFGHSEKPAITYSGYTWECQIGDFLQELVVNSNVVIGGNSIGGFTAMCAGANDATVTSNTLSASGGPGTGQCSGVILMNPAGIIQDQAEAAATQVTTAEKTIAGQLDPLRPPPLARLLGNAILAYLRPRIQSICVNLYPTNPAAVDTVLCQNILRDSLDPGAINVMISGTKLPPSRPYNELLMQRSEGPLQSTFEGPVLMPQGVLDPLNDAKARCEDLGKLRAGITIDPLQAGHCPHDEVPSLVAESIAKWMATTKQERTEFLRAKELVA